MLLQSLGLWPVSASNQGLWDTQQPPIQFDGSTSTNGGTPDPFTSGANFQASLYGGSGADLDQNGRAPLPNPIGLFTTQTHANWPDFLSSEGLWNSVI